MVNYIRAEFYKVFRRRYTWITLVVLLALEALMVAGWMFTNSHGNHVDFYTGAGMLCVMLALGFYATLLTCDMVFADQYKNRHYEKRGVLWHPEDTYLSGQVSRVAGGVFAVYGGDGCLLPGPVLLGALP